MIIYALNPVNISFNIFINYFWYYALAIGGFIITGIIILYLLNTKDIIRELPPLAMPNTGNMGLPICLFAYEISRTWCFSGYICFNYFVSLYFRSFFS